MAAAAAWRQLVAEGPGSFGDLYYVGQIPFGDDLKMHEVLAASYRGADVEFYFDPENGDLAGVWLATADDIDPAVVYFSDFRDVDGRHLPYRWDARFGSMPYVEFAVDQYERKDVAAEVQP